MKGHIWGIIRQSSYTYLVGGEAERGLDSIHPDLIYFWDRLASVPVGWPFSLTYDPKDVYDPDGYEIEQLTGKCADDVRCLLGARALAQGQH